MNLVLMAVISLVCSLAGSMAALMIWFHLRLRGLLGASKAAIQAAQWWWCNDS